MLRKQSYSLSMFKDKNTMVSVTLVVNAFVWYYTVLILLETTVNNIWILFIHFSAIIISALLGASLAKRVKRSRLLIIWMLVGIFSSTALFGVNNASWLVNSLIAIALGVSLGLGMPTCMSYYTDCVNIENRGRVSGIIILLSGIGIFAFAIAPIVDNLILGGVLAVWRLIGLIIFLSTKSFQTKERKTSFSSYKSILTQQSFFLYFVPWIMFSLVNYLGAPFQPNPNVSASNLLLIQIGFMGASAVVGGFFLDSIGRKHVAIAGFAMLGIGTAVRSLYSDVLSLFFNAVIDGIAWGFLLVLFILTLWSDLSYSSASDKYYALGVLPFFASMLLEFTVGQYVVDHFETSALFSFTAFFLFLAVLPLVYAPETLPEKITQKRQLESYIEKAKKEVAKAQKKEENKQSENEKAKEKSEEAPEDAEARKLAEKYY
jgi:MFS family permease